MRLLHCADIHLGRQPFGLAERFEDFARAFRHIGERAVEEGVDALLIGGDLFDKRNINAATLARAMDTLSIVRAAGVEVIAIEGNHDKAFRHDRFSWLEYLSAQGTLRLLKPMDADDGVALPMWDNATRSGAILDMDDVRIVGLGYRGAKTDSFLSDVNDELEADPDRLTILMLHSGVGQADGLIGLGSASKEALFALEDRVDLALLGHWHRRIEWTGERMTALMPGAPEVCDIDEANYERGFYLIDTEPLNIAFEPSPYRPHRRIAVDADGIASAELVTAKAAEAVVALDATEPTPVVEITLVGDLPFDPIDVSVEEIRAAAHEVCDALHVEVVNNANLPPPITQGKISFAGREAVERDALRTLVAESDDYATPADLVVDLAMKWKERALQSEDSDARDDDIIEMLMQTAASIDAAPVEEPTEPPPDDTPLTLPGFG